MQRSTFRAQICGMTCSMSLFLAIALASSGTATAQDAKAPLPGMPQWISIEYAGDNYASPFGDRPFSLQAPMMFQTAKGVPVETLADHGAQLIKIREAFEQGMLEGAKIKEGDRACQADGSTLVNYSVFFKDGTFIKSNTLDVVTLAHAPASWAPLFPVADTAVYDLQDIKLAGFILAAMYRQPCEGVSHFLAMGKGRLYSVRHELMRPIPPPPPPSPSSMEQ